MDNGNKKIFKNTIVLYIKLIVSTLIGLYVSREVLILLGEQDFGLYSVVGGIVTLLNFLSTVMASTSYRYIAIEIGKGEHGNVNRVFNTVFVVHIILSILVFLFGDTVGLWYVAHHLNVTADKIADAQFVLQTSIIAAMANVVAVPFLGTIVAKEKFFYNSLVDIGCHLLKLAGVILLMHLVGDKLRQYAFIIMAIEVVKFLAASVYCLVKERYIIKWRFNKNFRDYKEIFSYSGWIMLGATACVCQTQGLAIIINRFFSTVVNAAFGIAQQVNSYIMMFVKNLSQAAVPQMMKSYSAGNTDRTIFLLTHITKYAFFIMLIPTVPCIICMQDVLNLWLVSPPAYTAEFATLLLVNGLINSLGSGFDSVIQATGRIKKYQIGFSIIYLCSLPISIVLFSLGFSPYSIIVANIFLSVGQLSWQVYILTKQTDFEVLLYWRKTLVPIAKVSVSATPLIVLTLLVQPTLLRIGLISIVTTVYLCVVIFFWGLDAKEKSIVKSLIIKLRRNQ